MSVSGEHDERGHDRQVFLVGIRGHDFSRYCKIFFEFFRPRAAEFTKIIDKHILFLQIRLKIHKCKKFAHVQSQKFVENKFFGKDWKKTPKFL